MPQVMLYSLQFLFLLKIKRTNVLNGAAISQDVFSFKFAAYQPLQYCQISCANKQQVETNKNIHVMFIAWITNAVFMSCKH